MSVTDNRSELDTLVNSRNVKRVRPQPYGDKPPSAAVMGTAEVCGKCFGRIEPDELVCVRYWATYWSPGSWWNGYQSGYHDTTGPWCLDCAVVPYLSAGESYWDGYSSHRYHGGTCGTCGRRVIKMSTRRRLRHFFCCRRCEHAYYTRRRAEQRSAAREKTCEVCGESFTATRRDARTCSPACKQKAYRQRQKQGAA